MKALLTSLVLLWAGCPLLAEEIVDAGTFGFLPEASAEANAAALQKALDGGRKTVTITKIGVYPLDRTIYMDSNTTLKITPGVILQKAKAYSFVVTNRGVLDRTWNENITVENLQISANNFSVCPGADSPMFGMRGQLNFCRVRNLVIRNYKNLDVVGAQYSLQVCGFENLTIDRFEIRGAKDGLHIGAGKNFVIRDGFCDTHDDGLAFNANDYPSGQPFQGTIENGVIENIELHSFGGRLLTGAWADWHDGILLQNGDTVRHGQNVYRVVATFDTTQYASHHAPTHTVGMWKDEESGLKFVHNASDASDRASIRNLTFRNITFHSLGMHAWWEFGKYHRAMHPDVKPENYPVCQVKFENVTMVNPKADAPVSGNSNMSVEMKNVKSASSMFRCSGNALPVKCDVKITDTVFPQDANTQPDIVVKGKITGSVTLENNTEQRPVRMNLAEGVEVSR